ncbi:MAG: hypothetical protein IT379_39675 [Deltaproteobacteria bacterium]|nr:hypothetical protein [Deltaproteobacteria bacterium]
MNDSGDLLALVGAVGKSGKLFLCTDGCDTDDAVQQVVGWLQLHGATGVAERRISASSFDGRDFEAMRVALCPVLWRMLPGVATVESLDDTEGSLVGRPARVPDPTAEETAIVPPSPTAVRSPASSCGVLRRQAAT